MYVSNQYIPKTVLNKNQI